MALRKLTSLVDAAGEALGITEDPLATIIGKKYICTCLIHMIHLIKNSLSLQNKY